jgi:raffinose/stachyose/melibiose transport system substrate-binding protein
MRKKKLVSAFAVVIALSLLLVACSGNTNKSSSVTSTTSSGVAPVATAATLQLEAGFDPGVDFTVWQQILANFAAAYPTIKIVMTDPGSKNYNAIMNVKMAANDMPDIMGTAGWATTLYDKYLVDLRNEPWASEVSPGIKAVVTNATTGKLEGLPMDQNLIGLTYNLDLIKSFGIDPATTLKTYAGFLADGKIIKDKSNGSVYSLFVGGGDGWPLGVLVNYMTQAYFITPKVNDAAALLDGTFDWSHWTAFATQINNLYTSGYLNSDFLTAHQSDQPAAMAQGKCVFDWGFGDIPAVHALNPNINFDYVPIPTMKAGDTPAFAGGEKIDWGIWNQSKYVDDGRIFLDYCARPSNIELMSESEGLPAGLDNVTVVTGFDAAKFASFNARIIGVFDRTYLPNGMWNYMNLDAGQMAAGKMTPQQYSDDMKTNYLRLFAAAKASS